MPTIVGNNIKPGYSGLISGKFVLPDGATFVGDGASIFKKMLPFSASVFANTSPRYILAKNPTTGLYEITGPFGSNVLATRSIGGVEYAQIESQKATENTYSEVFRGAISNWTNANSDVDDDDTTSPIGDSTADRIYENTVSNLHGAVTGFSVDGLSRYYGVIFVKAAERAKCYLNFAGTQFVGAGPPECKFNLTTKLPYDNSVECTDYGMIELVDGWFMIYISAVSDVSGTGYFRCYLVDESDQISYTGDGSSGLYLWGANIIKSDHLTSYIQAVASAVTRSPDVLYFPSAAVPSWTSNKFKVKLIPNYDIPETTNDKTLWEIKRSASTLVTGYDYRGMAASATTLYWAGLANGKIFSMPIDGGSVTEEVTGLTTVTDVAVDATNLYWCDRGTGKVSYRPIGGGSTTDLATGETSPQCLTVDASNVYWTDLNGGTIKSVPISGGSPTTIASALSTPIGIAIDTTRIYYAEDGTQSIKSIPIGGGTATTIASSQGAQAYLAISTDKNRLFFRGNSNTELRCIGVNGGAVDTIVSESNITAVAVYDHRIFYSTTDASGTIRKIDFTAGVLTTSGTIKVVEGPDTMVETSAATASMHQNVEIEFQPGNGVVKLSGFTSGDGTYTDTAYTDPTGYNLYEGCALGGACQIDGLISTPIGS